MKIFAESFTKQEAENAAESSYADEEIRSDEYNNKSKKRLTKDTMAHDATDGISADCDNTLVFIQEVALKSPQVQAAPLSLRVDKRATGWFRQWSDSNLKRKEHQDKAAPKITTYSRESSVN